MDLETAIEIVVNELRAEHCDLYMLPLVAVLEVREELTHDDLGFDDDQLDTAFRMVLDANRYELGVALEE